MITIWIYVILIILLLIFAYYVYSQYAYLHFKRLGIDYFQPTFPFGNFNETVWGRKNMSTTFKEFHLQIKSGFAGIFLFQRPALMIRDRDLIERILITDFESFTDRGAYNDEVNDPLSSNMYTFPGEKWKKMRKKLCPLYAQGKMKMIFPAIYDIGMALQGHVGQIADKNSNNRIDLKDLFARYLTDVIASVAFGIEVDSIRDPTVYFRKMGAKAADRSVTSHMILYFFYFTTPKLFKFLKLRIVDREIEEFMIETVRRTLNFRENNRLNRDDFFQLLIKMRNGGSTSLNEDNNSNECFVNNQNVKHMTIEECASQVFICFAVGFDTTSSVMACCLLELARNPDILKNVQDEIDCVLNKHNWKLSYDCIQDMKYLSQCIDGKFIFISIERFVKINSFIKFTSIKRQFGFTHHFHLFLGFVPKNIICLIESCSSKKV